MNTRPITDFMVAAFEGGDVAYVAHALGVIARAKGMAQIDRQTRLSHERLYRSLRADGKPTLAVMQGLGTALSVKTATAD